jgi:hypothetical protein
VFRDDHEAAVARLAALEDELKRERDKDIQQEGRIAQLEAQLAAGREKLRETEAELAKYRPPPARPRNETAGLHVSKPPQQASRGVAIAAMGFLAFVVVLALLANRSSPPEDPVSPSAAEPRQPFLPDEISGLMSELRSRGEAQLPGSHLIDLTGKGITSEGRLHATYGELAATFYRKTIEPVPAVDPNLPVGAAPPQAPIEEQKCAYLRRTASGWGTDPMYGMIDTCLLGTDIDLFDPMYARETTQRPSRTAPLEPTCSMRSIWARAIADGAPRDAIAEISIQRGRWRFEINDQRLQFARRYDDDCTH